jgi:hypothetical protein
MALQKKILQSEALPLIIQSDSMEPVLKVGHQYQVEHFPYDQLQEFDIVVFLQGAQLMAHFLWHFNSLEMRWQTRSLRYPQLPDCPFAQMNYLGKITTPSISYFHRLLFKARVMWTNSA